MEPGCLYVSSAGDDNNPGTKDQPLFSLTCGLERLKELRAGHTGIVKLMIAEGTWYLQEPLVLTPEFSGEADAPTMICAEGQASSVISGGLPLDLVWERYDEQLFVANVPAGLSFTRLYVNGKLANLCRYPNIREDDILGGCAKDGLSVERTSRWSNPVGGYVHGLSHHRWGSLHYRITGMDESWQVVMSGGKQVNRESRLHEEYRYVENVFEELDSPNEWYLDRKQGKLYYYPPEELDLAKAEFIAAVQQILIDIRGTAEHPVRHIHIEGLTFTHTDRTIMETYEPLLRGDWSIVRSGAVKMTGAEDCSIHRSRFEELGGNALFLSGYQRRCSFTENVVKHCGASGVALVGNPSAVRSPAFWDSGERVDVAREPGPVHADYPSECIVEDNVICHTGELEKQTAGVFISMSESITVRRNTVFHVPRAAICINDGCWGGHQIEGNDLFDTVRETNDHGPFNAWGRDRHWRKNLAAGSILKSLSRLDSYKETVIRNNRFREYKVSFGVDLDDGCSNYRVSHNLCIGTGIKLREGFYRTAVNNILFGSPLRKGVCYPANEDVVARNVIVRIHEPDVWNSVMGSPGEAAKIDDNLFYIYSGLEPAFCFRSPREEGIRSVMSIAEWRERGHDQQSIVADPCFKDPQQLDFSLLPGSPAFQCGFEPLAMDEFGVTYAEQVPELQAALARFLPKLKESIFAKRDVVQSVYTFVVRTTDSIAWHDASIRNVSGEDEVTFTGLDRETGVIVTDIESLKDIPSPGGMASPNSMSPGSLSPSSMSPGGVLRTGLQVGDVILGVNGLPVDTVQDFETHAAKDTTWMLEVLRHQEMIQLTVSVG